METDRVIKALEVLENGGAGLLSGLEAYPIGTLLAKGRKERLHRRIIPAIRCSAHAHLDAQILFCKIYGLNYKSVQVEIPQLAEAYGSRTHQEPRRATPQPF